EYARSFGAKTVDLRRRRRPDHPAARAAKGQRAPSPPVKVRYGEATTLSSLPRDQLPDVSRPNSSFEAFGVIGLFTVSRLSYLITITGRQQVAQIRGYPVYVVTDVALTPCTSQTEAEAAIRHTSIQIRRANRAREGRQDGDGTTDDSDTDAASMLDAGDADDVQSDREDQAGKDGSGNNGGLAVASEGNIHGRKSSVAEDVIKRRGTYGRFAQRWFSHGGWMQEQARSLGVSDDKTLSSSSSLAPAEGQSQQQKQQQDATSAGETDERSKKEETEQKADKELGKAVVAETADKGVATAVSTAESLLPKLLRMAHIWFGESKSFYFSYDIDITRSLEKKGTRVADTPLHQTADPLFFWNRGQRERAASAVDAGVRGPAPFVMDRDPPQVDSDTAPNASVELSAWKPREDSSLDPDNPPEDKDLRSSEKKFLITVISRRSTERAGLRYLRRGIDDQGNTANGVETEQILSTANWADGKVHSFVQIRGSIPLFFTQSPYSLKPVPELQHSEATNFRAFSRHFDQLGARYGKMQLVNLVEKHGVESLIGNAYEKNVEIEEGKGGDGQEQQLLDFEWFDFHSACRGMKFENVSLLLDILGPRLEEWGSTVEEEGCKGDDHQIAMLVQKQKGALRTNCMDCLDRTNVCQSSFGKHMLEQQFKEEGFDMAAQLDQQTSWFNTLWADNGDAISKQYASTAAMKGDYTRTRKRDYRGMVNDLGLSLTRFYNGMVNDYFSQAAIDFFLGNVTSLVFEEFEATMMTKDPAVSMARMREQAIETSRKIVVEEDKEDFIGGWTLLSPHHSDTIKSLPFEEVVLLLTGTALYLCRFDWKLDKVSSFERVDMSHVLGIQVGAYITSTISPAQADESKNMGLVVTYEPGEKDIRRVNTRSLSSVSGPPQQDGSDENTSGTPAATSPTSPSGGGGGVFGPIFGAGRKQQEPKQPPKRIALKALYAQSSFADARAKTNINNSRDSKVLTEAQQVDMLASEIERLAFVNQPIARFQGEAERKSIVERQDIISLAEAKRNTGLLEQLGHTIKKLVWA
ncbi:uncharacterized protein PG998_002508, partial [Apiospora kogelbergensis]|uniref:uncharacterized protein n=1 Tax=Apiospora kogelbergensis TaxID=1337665 RepID=UPI0031327C48